MKRIDTLSEKAKAIYYETIETAKALGRTSWWCRDLPCKECPFYDKSNRREVKGTSKSRTVRAWKAWANKEVEEVN